MWLLLKVLLKNHLLPPNESCIINTICLDRIWRTRLLKTFFKISYWIGLNKYYIWSLGKMPKFQLSSWCGNFVERHSFLIVSEKKNCYILTLWSYFMHIISSDFFWRSLLNIFGCHLLYLVIVHLRSIFEGPDFKLYFSKVPYWIVFDKK